MSDPLAHARATLAQVFGFADFRAGQEEVLRAVIAGEDVFAVMPTGSGKSLCYQLPALLSPGVTVVVSPLIALMRDQVQQLRDYGVAAGALNSANETDEHARVDQALRARTLRLLYLSPERLSRPDTVPMLRAAGVDRIAIDEAHCVAQWGHDFRPEYMALRGFADALKEGGRRVQTIAVTATADPPTRDEIVAKLFPGEPRIFVRSFDRPNLTLAMVPKRSGGGQVEAFVAAHQGESGIVYCNSRKRTEKIAEDLNALGHYALPYHAGLAQTVRAENQDIFLSRSGVVMVATIAFGMGIDKPDVRFVCHADLPSTVESYYQEIGRAGRDGLPADTLTIYGEGDVTLRRRQIAEGEGSPERKRAETRKLEALLALCESPRCRRQTLLAAFGEPSQRCGNCDVCAGGMRFFNGAIEAQKVMSGILRTSGRFFGGHIANLLAGEKTDAIARHGHDALPTFGAGRDRPPAHWRSIFRQLQAAELIDQDAEDRDRWVVTQAGRRVLRGEETIELREAAAVKPDGGLERWKGAAAPAAPISVADSRLLAALKTLRLELAKAGRVPAYVIFTDRTLADMAAKRPRSLADMAHVHGVGEQKLARYGQVFLETIAKAG